MSSSQSTLGKYQIIREIARSNDIVYEAYDPLMNRRVALKELAMPNGSSSQQKEERIQRFKREARAAGTLAHPNIMTVFELGEEGDRFYIAMEYLDGRTLRNEIDTKGALDPDRAVEIAICVLKGLSFAHAHGVIHRDIKPDNIQILSDNRVKITDFGIARLTFEPNLTMDGQIFGTPSYMSPEQVNGKEIDQRSDIFSVGVMLYEMVSGQKPFPGDSVISITYAIMNSIPTQPAGCGYGLWQVIEKALDKSPTLRFSSAEEMISALENAQHVASQGMVIDPPQYGVYDPYMQANQPLQQPPYPSGMYGQPNVPAPMQYPTLYPGQPYPQQSYPMGQPSPYGQPSPFGQPTIMSPQGMNSPFVPGQPPQAFYPPPPRPPMFNPETIQMFGQIFKYTAIFVTAIGLIIVLIQALTGIVQKQALERKDEVAANNLDVKIQSLPVDEQIQQLTSFIHDVRSDVVKEQEQSKLADLYRMKGQEYFATRSYPMAEDFLIHARDLDPTNTQYVDDLSQVYTQVASESRDAQERMMLFSRSSQLWATAAHMSADPQARTAYSTMAAQAGLNAASISYQTGDLQQAKNQLLDIKNLVKPQSQLSLKISGLLARLTH